MVEAKNLEKIYRIREKAVRAVDKVSFIIQKGDLVSIIGHSGSGKTTLLNIIGGLTKPDSGIVKMDGIDLWSMNDNALSAFRNRKIGFTFQFASLVPTLNALENVLFPLSFSALDVNTFCHDAVRFLDMVGLIDKLDAYPSQLSGGQQRRVAIARAFISNPEIIFADEPTGDLDEETETDMMELFKEMNRKMGITIVLVTHNPDLAKQAARCMKMQHGKLTEL